MPGNIDFNQLPTWLLVLLIIINIFKQPLSAFVPSAIRDFFTFRAKREADREEFQQGLEETLVNSRLQTEAAEHLRRSWREEQWVELIQNKDAWLQDVLDKKLDALQAGQTKLIELTTQVQRNTLRSNDLLTAVNANLSKISDLLQSRPGYIQQFVEREP